MKVKLLNDGGYGDMADVKFPVIVDAARYGCGFDVNASELYRVGAKPGTFGASKSWHFLEKSEAEEVAE